MAAAHGQRLWRGFKGRRRARHIRSRRDLAYRNWTKTVVRLSAKRYAEEVEKKAAELEAAEAASTQAAE